MKIEIEAAGPYPLGDLRVGNVYSVRGGRGLRDGNMMILLAITVAKDQYDSPKALMFIVDREGNPRGVTHYGVHYVEELTPIAFVDGIEDLRLTMRSL